MTEFYKTSGSYTYTEFVRHEDVIKAVDSALVKVIDPSAGLVLDDVEENSFKSLALLWQELPVVTGEEREMRASRASQMAMTKLVCNFLISQDLFIEVNERYYPTDRLKALTEQYFEEYRGQIYELLERGKDHAEH